jgi:hypothetical protein
MINLNNVLSQAKSYIQTPHGEKAALGSMVAITTLACSILGNDAFASGAKGFFVSSLLALARMANKKPEAPKEIPEEKKPPQTVAKEKPLPPAPPVAKKATKKKAPPEPKERVRNFARPRKPLTFIPPQHALLAVSRTCEEVPVKASPPPSRTYRYGEDGLKTTYTPPPVAKEPTTLKAPASARPRTRSPLAYFSSQGRQERARRKEQTAALARLSGEEIDDIRGNTHYLVSSILQGSYPVREGYKLIGMPNKISYDSVEALCDYFNINPNAFKRLWLSPSEEDGGFAIVDDADRECRPVLETELSTMFSTEDGREETTFRSDAELRRRNLGFIDLIKHAGILENPEVRKAMLLYFTEADLLGHE